MSSPHTMNMFIEHCYIICCCKKNSEQCLTILQKKNYLLDRKKN